MKPSIKGSLKTYYMAAAALIAMIGIGLAPIQANAQTTPPTHKRVTHVDQRLEDQKAQIHEGVKSGQLTKHQAKHLLRKDAAITAKAQSDRIKNGGHLTKAEQKRLNAKLNHNSKAIAKDKNGAVVK